MTGGLFPVAVAALLAQLLQAFWGERGRAVAASLIVVALWRGFCPAGRRQTRRWRRLAYAAVLLAVVLRVTAEPAAVGDAGSIEALCATSARTTRRLLVELRRPARVGAGGWRATVEARAVLRQGRWQPISGRLRLSVRHPPQRPWPPGTRLVFDSSLRWIDNWGNPGEFDWRGWNRRRGVFVSAFVWSAVSIESYPAGGGGALLRARAALAAAALSGGGMGGALIAAIVSGLRGLLADTGVDAMRASGLAHLLAISGLHMGIVAGALLCFGRGPLATLLGARRGLDALRIAACLAGAAVSAYAVVSGGGVSVTRALIMTLAALASLALGRGREPLQAFSAALLLLSLWRPGVATEVGFQLSFAAATVLLLRAARWRGGAGSRLAPLKEAAEISLLTWAVTTPIVAHHFYRVSLVAPLANLLAAPAAAAGLVLGLSSAALLGLWAQAAELGFWLAARCGDLVLAIATAFARCPGAGLPVVDPGAPIAALWVLTVFAWSGLTRWRRPALLLLAAALAVSLADCWHQRYRDDRLDLYFVSVGHGDATVARLPGGAVMVIDGGAPGRGTRVVAPLLRRLRIGRIDYLLISHLQSDHWSGAAELAREFPVAELWYGGGSCESADFRLMLETLRAAGTRVIAAGDQPKSEPGALVRQRPGSWRLRALWPTDADGSCQENDRSLVLALSFAGHRALFTGDLGRAGEARLLRSGARLSAEVLKVGHHGSAGSSSEAFLRAVAPRLAIVSVSSGGRSGLPAEAALERLRRSGARIFRTDRDGGVVVSITASTVTAAAAKRL